MSKLFSKYNYEINKTSKDEIYHLLKKNNFVQVRKLDILYYSPVWVYSQIGYYTSTQCSLIKQFISKFGTDYIFKVRLEK